MGIINIAGAVLGKVVETATENKVSQWLEDTIDAWDKELNPPKWYDRFKFWEK